MIRSFFIANKTTGEIFPTWNRNSQTKRSYAVGCTVKLDKIEP